MRKLQIGTQGVFGLGIEIGRLVVQIRHGRDLFVIWDIVDIDTHGILSFVPSLELKVGVRKCHQLVERSPLTQTV